MLSLAIVAFHAGCLMLLVSLSHSVGVLSVGLVMTVAAGISVSWAARRAGQRDEAALRARSLAASALDAAEHDRARIGAQLQESIAQSLAAVRYHLAALAKALGNGTPASTKDILQGLAFAGNQLEDAVADVNTLAGSCYPRLLYELGLTPSLRSLAHELEAASATRITVAERGPDVNGVLRRLPRSVSIMLYRVAEEALRNAVRHASPSLIDVEIVLADDSVRMHIRDNGAGFDLAEAELRGPATGLSTMRARLALADGVVDIASCPASGTSVRITVPATPASRMPDASKFDRG